MKVGKIAILGTGGWGTALAVLWASRGREIILWGHTPRRVEEIARSRQNPEYLPSTTVPSNVCLTSELADCAEADLIVFVTPSVALRTVASNLQAGLKNEAAVLMSCTKGIEHGTGMRMSEILVAKFPGNPVAVLSGPNLAVEVAHGLPSATVLGCRDETLAEELQATLGSSRFRVYTSDEIVGIELGGA